MAHTSDDLPLVHQVGVAAQRRGAPGIARHANAGMRQRLGAHAHLDAGQQRGLAAVDAGYTQLGQPAAPGAVGQNHGLGHDQVQRRAAHAGADLHLLVALRLLAVVTQQPKVVVRPVESLRLATHLLASGLQVFGQPVQKRQRRTLVRQGLRLDFMHKARVLQPGFGDHGVQLVVPQIGRNWHPLQPGLAAAHVQGGLVQRHIQRHRRAIASLLQGVALHHLVGQHGHLVARHVHRGQALAPQPVNRAARQHGQPWCGNVNAHRDHAAAQARD